MLRRGNTDYYNQSIMADLAANTFPASLPANFPPKGGADPATNNCIWVGLATLIPDQSFSFSIGEPSTGGYARQPLITKVNDGLSSVQFYKQAPGMYGNTVGVQFPAPTANWSTNPIVAVTFWDVASGGNLLSWDGGIVPFFALTGMPGVYFPPGSLRVGINPGWGRRGMISEFLADAVCATLYTNAGFSGTASWVALCKTRPLPSDTDISSSREVLSPYGGNPPNYSRASIGSLTAVGPGRYGNSGAVQFAYPTGTWNTAMAWGLVSGQGSSGGNVGNLWFAGLLDPPRTMDQYRGSVWFPINGLQVGLGQ
ncbi:MAG: hypothetical protein KGL39_08005 [Patescibacteria group bacterium]|nr:hypothetical protein [Patescibacteria group bacterium]